MVQGNWMDVAYSTYRPRSSASARSATSVSPNNPLLCPVWRMVNGPLCYIGRLCNACVCSALSHYRRPCRRSGRDSRARPAAGDAPRSGTGTSSGCRPRTAPGPATGPRPTQQLSPDSTCRPWHVRTLLRLRRIWTERWCCLAMWGWIPEPGGRSTELSISDTFSACGQSRSSLGVIPRWLTAASADY